MPARLRSGPRCGKKKMNVPRFPHALPEGERLGLEDDADTWCACPQELPRSVVVLPERISGREEEEAGQGPVKEPIPAQGISADDVGPDQGYDHICVPLVVPVVALNE